MLRRSILALVSIVSIAAPARAGEIALVCSFQEEWCRLMATGFERETGVKVALIRRSTGEAYAQIKAEAARPRVDVWWGGTGDPHLLAAADGLTEPYRSPMLAQLHPWAVAVADKSGSRAIGVIAGTLAIAWNEPALAGRGLKRPACWRDLADPTYRGLIQSSDPNASGTAYTMLATVVSIMGEDGAMAYLKALDANVNSYARSGSIPARSVATGESPIGITFLDNALVQIAAGARDVRTVSPCEGTAYEVGSMSLIKGARNPEDARRFYDWALSAPAQALGVKAGLSFSIPSNRAAPLPEGVPDMSTLKLVDYDFVHFGRPETRTRLLRRFDTEVRGAVR
ncbi:MAG: ABC transporter substrate-binding protein [Rhodospirillales bacterium]|nr:ABC transporter substrate-binding protein [Rhodospirillales bacterium]